MRKTWVFFLWEVTTLKTHSWRWFHQKLQWYFSLIRWWKIYDMGETSDPQNLEKHWRQMFNTNISYFQKRIMAADGAGTRHRYWRIWAIWGVALSEKEGNRYLCLWECQSAHQGSEQSYEVTRRDRVALWLARSNSNFLKCFNPRERLWQFWEREQNGGSREGELTKAKTAVLLLRRPGEERQSQCLRAWGRAALSEEMQVEPAAKGLWIIWALRNLIFLVDGFVTPIMKYTNWAI